MLRVTTNSTIYTYQKNLLKSTNQLYSAMNAMMSGRNFDSYAADPAAATRAFKIHSSLNATNTQASNNTTVSNKFSTAWDVADDIINDLVTDLAQAPALKGLNDTNLSTLNTQGDVIYSGAEAIVQSLNSKYDNSYLFNGADTQNPPFALEQDNGKTYVTYRHESILSQAGLCTRACGRSAGTDGRPAQRGPLLLCDVRGTGPCGGQHTESALSGGHQSGPASGHAGHSG